MKNEVVTIGDVAPMSDVVLAYEAETSIDQTIPIRRRMEAVGNIIVTGRNIDEAKSARKTLNALLKDASAPRMRVQRAIKAHPIGRWAFAKSDLEREIEAKSEHLKMEIEAQTRSEEVRALAEGSHRWCLIVEGTLTQVNKIVGKLAEDGVHVENRGPIEEEAI